ncbi:MAG TPA: hypothetical protein DEP69_07405, partial [Acidimicrobiaceae bacterium]|nr:hypothetical protein [Acidimicrobiaceae bacterium]
MARHDRALAEPRGRLERETALLWARTLRRLDLTARSIVAVVEPGSCFVGVLAELAMAADRTYMLDGTFAGPRPPGATGQAAAQLGGAGGAAGNP